MRSRWLDIGKVIFLLCVYGTECKNLRKEEGQYPALLLWLAPRAGKMSQNLRCEWLPEQARWSHLAHLGLPALSHKKNFPNSHIINPLLTKLVRSRWLDIGLVLFCLFMDLDSVSIHKHAKKEPGQYPAILTSHLVNNPNILTRQVWLIKDLLYMICRSLKKLINKYNLFSCWKKQVILGRQDSALLTAQIANHSAGFLSNWLFPGWVNHTKTKFWIALCY